jgi:hypothetical protein
VHVDVGVCVGVHMDVRCVWNGVCGCVLHFSSLHLNVYVNQNKAQRLWYIPNVVENIEKVKPKGSSLVICEKGFDHGDEKRIGRQH